MKPITLRMRTVHSPRLFPGHRCPRPDPPVQGTRRGGSRSEDCVSSPFLEGAPEGMGLSELLLSGVAASGGKAGPDAGEAMPQ